MPVKPTSGTTPPKPDTVDLKAPKEPGKPERERIQLDSHARLIEVIKEHADVIGHGQESAAKGDPRVTERRNAVAALLAHKNDDPLYVDMLNHYGDKVVADIEWLRAAELRDYSIDAKDQFSWSKSDMANARALQEEFKKHVDNGLKDANEFVAGRQRFFDSADGNIVGVRFLSNPEDRAKALVDTLWQMRARTDDAVDAETRDSWRNQTRIDKLGPVMVAEMRVVLEAAQMQRGKGSERREYALLREVIGSHPISSVNSIFEARNAVGVLSLDGTTKYQDKTLPTAWIFTEVPPGASASPYKSIHHNFSRDTIRNIQAFVDEWMFPVGPKEERATAFSVLTRAMVRARAGKGDEALSLIKALEKDITATTLAPLQTKLAKAGQNASAIADTLRDFLQATCTKDLGANVETNIEMAARTYRAVCHGRPTVETLAGALFKSGDAMPQVADVLIRLQEGDEIGLVKEIPEARQSLANAISRAKTGYERHQLLLIDAALNRLHCEELGSAVERVGDLKTDPQLAENLVALQSALKGVEASALDALALKPFDGSAWTNPLRKLIGRFDKALTAGKMDLDAYRTLMADTKVEVATMVQNARAFFDSRAADVASGGGSLDPEFIDQFVKQSPLHYATALAEKGMRAGLKEEIEPRRIANIEGMRVLNSIGPAVFPAVVFADSTKELAKMDVPRGAMSVVYELQEKKMVAVGGLIVDTEHAPGGNSHLNMYAMNSGIAVLALPELRTKYATFFENAAKEGGIYVNDEAGKFEMLTVQHAKDKGLITDADVDKLRPGVNRKISYLEANASGDASEVMSTHDATISPQRVTREVELYIPQKTVRGVGESCMSFEDLGKLGILGRHLAGEKGLVLAMLRGNPALKDYVPDGSVVTTGRIMRLLEAAGLDDDWNGVWDKDPKVGVVTDQNFMDSAFYTDSAYRLKTIAELQHTTKKVLTQHLVLKRNGKEKLTRAGQKLYDELVQNAALQGSDNWIARSSFTGEDRPGKSGAGQYESFPHLKDPVSRIKGVIGVIESAWMPEPIENNVADQINLRHIMPSVVVQHCLNPKFSGVAISRDVEHGTRNQVSYQMVKGFGGGVDGGKAEEGVLSASGRRVNVHFDNKKKELLPKDAMAKLRDIVLEVERFFDTDVEKGKGYAVDMEVAWQDDTWNVVQSRVILLDK